ncbi:MAG TPA: hypothetical protein PLI43_12205 [Albidovulum sp.]|uniref:hypothetical protein n=1 Tax=Albidovulum sp. TaxID=1872424 RepID=UPI002C2BF533|nr:hypothetical protein [Albidovulum sp.]
MEAEISGVRVERVELDGHPGWLKRRETVDLRRRLLKGNPNRLFEAERRAYRTVQRAGLPFPAIIDEGPDFFVVADAGPSLKDIALTEGVPSPKFRQGTVAAAKALARLHNAGLSHGRPAPRDICWQNGRITFIDLEKYGDRGNRTKGHVWDVLVFFYNLAGDIGGVDETVLAARDAYRAEDRQGIWDLAERRVRRLRWLGPVLRTLGRMLHDKRDFRAIGPFMDLFLGKP